MIQYSLRKLAISKGKGRKGRVRIRGVEPSPGVETTYARTLRVMVAAIGRMIETSIIPEVRAEYERRKGDMRLTQDAEFDFETIERAGEALARSATEKIANILNLEAQRADKAFMRQVQSTLGINLSSVIDSEDLRETLEFIGLRNAGLIKGLASDTVKNVRTTVLNAVLNGVPVVELKDQIKAQLGISDKRARIIARDQVAKTSSDITRLRHQQAGLMDYIWRTVKDERVRPRHARLEGREFSYGKPTEAEEGLPPGQPILCRCFAEAIIDFTFGVTPEERREAETELGFTSREETVTQRASEQAALAAQKAAEEAAKTAAAAEAAKKAARAAYMRARRAKIKAAQEAAAKMQRPPFTPVAKYYEDMVEDFPDTIKTIPGSMEALGHYQGSGYRPMNTFLRTGELNNPAVKQSVELLAEAIDKSVVPYDLLAYRGIGSVSDFVPGVSDVSKLLGAKVGDKGFMSISTRSGVSEKFARGNNRTPPPPPLMTEIRLRKGQKGLHLQANGRSGYEAEILLPPGTEFRVVEAIPKGYDGTMDLLILEID